MHAGQQGHWRLYDLADGVGGRYKSQVQRERYNQYTQYQDHMGEGGEQRAAFYHVNS